MKAVIKGLLLACSLAAPLLATERNVEALGRSLVEQLAARQFDAVEAKFDQRMSKAVPLNGLPAVWDKFTGAAGKFRGVVAVNRQDRGNFQIVAVTCRFEKGELDVRVVFDTDARVAGLFFAPATSGASWTAPSYARPARFLEQRITVNDGRWHLPGVLTLPKGPGPFAAVVLVQGSGPADQDETIGPNKPFKDLAWGLATMGVAVLRYNKRTYQYAREIAERETGFTANDETVNDARAAVALLAAQPKIDPDRVFVLGHSFGGTMAPRIAQGDSKVAGLIIMAGATRPLARAVVSQLEYLSSLHGSATPEEKKLIHEAEVAEHEIDSPSLKPDQTVNLLGASMPGSYFLDLRSYDPGEVAAGLKIPILVLQAGRDYQVTEADFDGWKRALAGDRRTEFKIYPGLYHLFMVSTSPGNGLGTSADYSHPDHVDEAVIRDVAAWIAGHGTPTPQRRQTPR